MDLFLNADRISSIRGMLNSSKSYVTHETQRLSEVHDLNDATEALLAENEWLKVVIEKQNKEIEELQKEVAKDFMKDCLHKYMLSTSKKGIAKRVSIKLIVFEIMAFCKIEFFGEEAIFFDHFDDEKENTINIERVNDIHDNGTVTI